VLCASLSLGVGVGEPDWLVVGEGRGTATSQPLALRQGPYNVREADGVDGTRLICHYSQASGAGKPGCLCTW